MYNRPGSYSVQEQPKPQDKAENRKAIREYHKQTLHDLGIPEACLDGKVAFMYNGRKVITAFGNQLNKMPNGFLFEITDSSNVPQDKKRTLYWIRPNPAYEEEYEEQADKNRTNGYEESDRKMYYYPVEEADVVNTSSAAIMKDKLLKADQLDAFVPAEDEHYQKLTILDVLAIMQCEPISNKGYLNEKIREINKRRK